MNKISSIGNYNLNNLKRLVKVASRKNASLIVFIYENFMIAFFALDFLIQKKTNK